MNLPPITPHQTKHNAQTIPESLERLIADGNVKPGGKLKALVKQVVELSNQQRQEFATILTKQTPRTLSKTLSPTFTNSATHLLQQPKLLAIELTVMNTKQWVVSDQALKPGQTIEVKIRQDRQLQLLPDQKPASEHTSPSMQVPNRRAESHEGAFKGGDTHSKSPEKTSTMTLNATKIRPNAYQRLPTDTPLSNPTKATTRHLSPGSAQFTLVTDSLKQCLPYEQKLSQVLQQLQLILQKSTGLAPSIKMQIVEEKAWQVMNQLVTSAKSPPALKQLHTLKASMVASGPPTNHEHIDTVKFMKGTGNQIRPQGTDIEHVGNLTTSFNPASQKENGIKTQLTKLALLTATPMGGGNVPSPTIFIPQHRLNQLFQSLSQLKNTDRITNDTQQTMVRVRQQIHLLAQAALHRFFSLQLQQLIQQSSEGTTSSGAAVVEIPVKVAEQFFPLTIHIETRHPQEEREQRQEKQDKKKEQHQKQKHWRVFMEFDLADHGMLASEIHLINARVQAKFWADHNWLRQQVEQNIPGLRQNLIKAGVEISEIHVARGRPPVRNIGLDCALVDVTT